MSKLGEDPNILLIIADDLGQDVVNITGAGAARAIEVVTNDGAEIVGAMPNVSLLLRNGLRFTQAWAQPACSPTRASIYTGFHPYKSGVGSPSNNPQLSAERSFSTIPELLPTKYVCGLFGKWHLGMDAGTWPTDHGWDKHVGTLDGVVKDYYEWIKYDSDRDNKPAFSYTYTTRDTVDEASLWINSLDPDTPWFATIAFHTPHNPFQDPPDGFTVPTAGNPASRPYVFNLMAQNMDYHIGRLIGSVTPKILPIDMRQLENTLIIFIGDNGSHESIAIEEEKTTIFEGGVRVPMIFADGRAVVQEMNGDSIEPEFLDPTRLNTNLPRMAHVVDLYKTILNFADPNVALPSGIHSRNLLPYLTDSGPHAPIRHYNFSQWYVGNSARATIRNSNYKLNYDKAADPIYSLYEYSGGEIPGNEETGTATNVYDDAFDGTNADAHDNLNQLFDELVNNYKPSADEEEEFPALS